MDIGCRLRPYDGAIKCEYIGLDLPSETSFDGVKKPDIFATGATLPFANNTFDLITCYSVVPYVKEVDSLFNEMYRVMKPEGVAIIIIMNLRGLELQPNTHFHNRYNSKKLHEKLKQHHFKSIKFRNLKTLFFSTYFDLTSVYAYAIVTPKK
ncbi:MAG: class I SAM-dependent methyltransferase [Nitrosopumilaceae archaeon]